MDYKIVLSIIATFVGFVGYSPYLRDLFARRTKPHAFSWLAWGVIEATACFAQIAKFAGWGALVTGASAAVALFIAGIAFSRKDVEIKILDWAALLGALLGIILWRLTNNPLSAVILVTVSDGLAFVPTFRKSYFYPSQETLMEYFLSVVKWSLAIFALQSLNLTTWLYPASLVLTNATFVIMVAVRRNSLNISKS
jgi:hypothetical protein